MIFRIFASVLLLLLATSVDCRKTDPLPGARVETVSPNPPIERAAPAEIDWSSFSSTSLRNPNDGALRGGVPLPLSAPGLQFNPKREPAARFGTVEMVRALFDAGQAVQQELGGLGVTINDLSYENGGPIPRHASHQNGRDVDVLFYQLGLDGKPIQSVGAFFDPKGIGVDFRDLADPSDDVELRLDLARTWRFVQALIENEEANLQSIYLAEHLRKLLLDYSRAHGASESTVARFAAMS